MLVAPKNKEAVPDLTGIGQTSYATVVGKYDLVGIIQTKEKIREQFGMDGTVPMRTDALEDVGYRCLSMAIIPSNNGIKVGQELSDLSSIQGQVDFALPLEMSRSFVHEGNWLETVVSYSNGNQFLLNTSDWYTTIAIPRNQGDGFVEIMQIPVCIPQVQYTNLDVPDTGL